MVTALKDRCQVRASGFTLIELLVVIAIISILAAILFPVFATAREKARQSTCASNEKQLGLAFMQYISDFDEGCPIYRDHDAVGHTGTGYCHGGWYGELYPYMKTDKVLYCPSDSTPMDATHEEIGYIYNRNLAPGTAVVSILQSKFSAPAQTVVVFEGANATLDTTPVLTNESQSPESDWENGGNAAGDFGLTGTYGKYCAQGQYLLYASTGPMGGQTNNAYDPQFPTGRHSGGSNFLLADGHVKWLKGSNVSPGYTADDASVAGGNCSGSLTTAQATCKSWSGGGNYNAAATGALATGGFAVTFSTL